MFLTAFLLVALTQISFGMVVNEIMYDPTGADSNHEWVELYNNESYEVNITGWKLSTDSSDHSLNIPPINGGQGDMTIAPGEYFIIAQSASTFLADYTTFNQTVIDSSWTDISNSGNHTLLVKNSTVVFDNITYESSAQSGNSVCRGLTLFYSCQPTPGYANHNASSDSNRTIFIDIVFYKNITARNISIVFNVTNLFNNTWLDIGGKLCGSCSISAGDYTNLNLFFQENETKTFNYSVFLTEVENITYIFIAAARLSENPTSYFNKTIYMIPEKLFMKPDIINIFVENIAAGETGHFWVNFSNQDDDLYYGNITAKIKRHDGSWIDIFNVTAGGLNIFPGGIIYDINWTSLINMSTDEYRLYVRYDYVFDDVPTYIYSSSSEGLFNISGIGNVFILNWSLVLKNFFNQSDQLNFSIYIKNNETDNKNLSIYFVIDELNRLDGNSNFFCINYTIELNSTALVNCTIEMPDDMITDGVNEYESYIKISFFNGENLLERSGSIIKINVSGLIDYGKSSMDIISYRPQARFGDYSFIKIKYYTGNYNHSVRLLAYGYPNQIISDFSGDSVTASSYQSDSLFEIDNVTRNQTINVVLPFLIKPNCDQFYSEGSYRVRVRSFNPSWDEIATEDFNITMYGRNPYFCQSCPTVVCGSSGGSTSSQQMPYELLEYPTSAGQNDEFSIKIKVINYMSVSKKFEAYSYVSDETKPVTLGYNGSEWDGTWSANKNDITIPPSSSATFVLRNIVENGTEPGKYNLYIRISSGEKKYSFKIPFIVTKGSGSVISNKNPLNKIIQPLKNNRSISAGVLPKENATAAAYFLQRSEGPYTNKLIYNQHPEEGMSMITGMAPRKTRPSDVVNWLLKTFGIL
jgi:hypothetical protein